MTSPEQLPQPIEEVSLPEYFNPSTFWKIKQCALSVFGPLELPPDELLPPLPAALFGTLLHTVREVVGKGLWLGFSNPQEAVTRLYDRYGNQFDELLAAQKTTRYLSPLRRVVGRSRRLEGLQRLDAWASKLAAPPIGEPPESIDFDEYQPANVTPPSQDTFIEGTEASIVHNGLRLRGRPDEIRRTGEGIEVVEFKSGRVFDSEGKLLPRIILQVSLYLLAIEELSGGHVRGVVQAGRDVPIDWNEHVRESAREALQQADERFPSGSATPALDIASPGKHCRFCRMRHLCNGYQEFVPNWWPNGFGNPRPLPHDVWGTVESSTRNLDGTTSIQLRDPNDRPVLVENLRPDRCIEDITIGKRLWFFDLETSEVSNHHGAQIHPKNFHDISPGPRWPSAKILRVYTD